MTMPIVEKHNGVLVVRDDLFDGGTKARFIPLLLLALTRLPMQARQRAALKLLLPL